MKYGCRQGSWLTLGMSNLHDPRSVKVSFNGYPTKRYPSLSGVCPRPSTRAASPFCRRALRSLEAEVLLTTERCPGPLLGQGQGHGTDVGFEKRHCWKSLRAPSGPGPGPAPAVPSRPRCRGKAAPLGCPLAAGPGRGSCEC